MSSRMDGCVKCGACIASCPVISVAGQTEFPGPRRIAVEAPRFGPQSNLNESLFKCTTCGLCEEACPSKMGIPRAILELREKAPKIEIEGRRKMLENLELYGRTVPPNFKFNLPLRKDGLVYFPGCIENGRTPESSLSAVGILLRSGKKVGLPPEWFCCGSPLEKMGNREGAERLRVRNLKVLEGTDLIITSCPGCTMQLDQKYGLEVIHFLEYFHDEVDFKAFEFRTSELKVALHQPCHLVRGVGPHTIDYAFSILSSIPGVKLVELEDPSACCGGGGGVRMSHPQLAKRMAENRVRDAERSGADLIVSPCPFCVVNLRQVGRLPVEDVSTLIRERWK